MRTPIPWRGLVRCFSLSLRLNFRSTSAVVYGYAVPVLFLLAFGGIFRADTPPLQHEMGQLLTITILGGACFGFPTALVSDRERGVWRRYRLLPVSTPSLVGAIVVARLLLIASGVLLQFGLARLVFGTPWPSHPILAVVGVAGVTFAFLGIGLLTAALADDVPAVQALGQCLFLPMIMIGGVGVPLIALPEWAQRLAGFMPGRYAVDVLQRSISEPRGWHGAAFSGLALMAIGLAAGWAGAALFRWDSGQRVSRRALTGAGLALAAWLAVGTAGLATGRLAPVRSMAAYDEVTDADIAAIQFTDLPSDHELVTRLAPPFVDGVPPARVAAIAAALRTWPAAHTGDVAEDVRALLCVAAIADIGADLQEAEIARLVYDELQRRYRHPELRRLLAWVILHPTEGAVMTSAPELDLRRQRPTEKMVRERCSLYAKKFLGRLTGAIASP